jgi:glutamine amidotransferase
MCRIAAYYGPPVRLSAILTEPPHGLGDQSRNAREMKDGSVAGDGWGVGWIPAHDPNRPGMIKSLLPLWADENARTATHAICSNAIVGHIRFASPGIEVCFTNTPLFPLDEWLWTVNGELKPWPGPLGLALRERLDPDHEAAVRGSTDAELLGALWRTERRRHGPADGLRAAFRVALDLARRHGGGLNANALLGGADGLIAARFASEGETHSLYTLADEPRWPGAVLIASEPLDDAPGWRAVPPSSLVVVDRDGLHVEPLDLDHARDGARGRSKAPRRLNKTSSAAASDRRK